MSAEQDITDATARMVAERELIRKAAAELAAERQAGGSSASPVK